jgi:hypothetical protein
MAAVTFRTGRTERRRIVPTVVRFVLGWAFLVLVDLLSLLGFKSVYGFLRRLPQLGPTLAPEKVPALVWAVDEAAIWYPKRVYCLQRSAVLTALLRLFGVPARLVIGYRPVPVDSHAWVEVDGVVVNDLQQYKRFYTVLDTI